MTEKKIAFYQSVKFLRRWLKPNTVVYFDELMDQYKLWKENPQEFQRIVGTPFKGVFYRSRKNIAENTNLKKGAQLAAEEILKDMGLLTVIHQPDHPNWYKIDFNKLNSLHQEYQEEQDRKKAERAKVILPDNYEELVADYQEPDEGQENTQTTSDPESDPAPVQNADRNNNRILRIDNKNKVSKDTYVPEGTDSLNQELDCVEHIKISCIKKKEAQSPPSSADDKEIYEIINQYNDAMGYVIADGDYETVRNNLDDFRKLKSFFTPLGLSYAWKNFPDAGAKKKLTKPRISTIVSFKLMKTFLERREEISSYCIDVIDMKLDKVFKYYRNFLNTIDPPKYQVNLVGGLCMNGSFDSLYGKGHREERYKLYKEYIEPKLLQDEDIYDMIIDMEVN